MWVGAQALLQSLIDLRCTFRYRIAITRLDSRRIKNALERVDFNVISVSWRVYLVIPRTSMIQLEMGFFFASLLVARNISRPNEF